MIIKLINSNSASNSFRYVAKDDSVRISTNMGAENPGDLAKELRYVAGLNPRVKYCQAVHIVVSLSPGETLSDDLWERVGLESLNDLGFGDCPYEIRKHVDRDHSHIHIVTSPVNYDGVRVDRGGDRYQAKKTARRLEQELGLHFVKNEKIDAAIIPPPEVTMAVPEIGTPAIPVPGLKEALHQVIQEEIAQAKNVGDLAQRLLVRGVKMEATVAAKTGKVTGLGYRLLGPDGGFLDASEIHSSLTLRKLETKHHLAFESDRDLPHMRPQRPTPPVQVVLPMLTPKPSHPRIEASARTLAKRLLKTYRSSPYARPHRPDTTATATRARWRRAIEIRRPVSLQHPAVSAEQFRPGTGSVQQPGVGAPGSLQPVVPGGEPHPARHPNPSPTLGGGLPDPTQGVAGAESEDPRLAAAVRPDARDAGVADVDVPRGSAPRGGGSGGQAPAPTGASGPGVPPARGDHPGGGSGDGLGPEKPGQTSPSQPNAPGGPDRPRQPEAPPAPGAGQPSVGGERGSGSSGGRSLEAPLTREELIFAQADFEDQGYPLASSADARLSLGLTIVNLEHGVPREDLAQIWPGEGDLPERGFLRVVAWEEAANQKVPVPIWRETLRPAIQQLDPIDRHGLLKVEVRGTLQPALDVVRALTAAAKNKPRVELPTRATAKPILEVPRPPVLPPIPRRGHTLEEIVRQIHLEAGRRQKKKMDSGPGAPTNKPSVPEASNMRRKLL